MADRKITDFLTLATLKTNTIFTVVDPDEAAAVDQNKKITVFSMFSTFEPTFSKNTAFNKNFAGTGAATTVARSDHNHTGVYEPAFSKNTAFNKDFGTGAGQVAEGDHTHTGVYEPVFSKNTAFNKDFGGSGAATTVARSDHNHSGVYEPVFSKNTAFNKNFAGTGAATTVSRSDHTHTNNLESLIDVQFSAKVAGDLFYYNGSLWTNLPNAQAKNTFSYWNNGGSGNNIAYSTGTVEVGNTLILSSVAADAGFSTSALLSLDSAGNVDKIAASGGGTTNFLRADGTWAAPPGGGSSLWTDGTTYIYYNGPISVGHTGAPGHAINAHATDEHLLTLQNTTATTGEAVSIDLVVAGNARAWIRAQRVGTEANAGTLLFQTVDTGGSFNGGFKIDETGKYYLFDTPATSGTFSTATILTLNASTKAVEKVVASGGGTTKFLRADGTWVAPAGSGGGIVDGGSSTQNGATYTVDCGSNEQYKETIITDDTTSTWTISNLDFEALLFVENTDATDKTLTLSATGMVFINMDAKVAKTAATTTLAITVPGGVNYTHEISIVDSGLVDGADKVIHVKQG